MKTPEDDGMEEMSSDCCPCIYLNDDQVEALGIKGVPVPGTTMRLVCNAVITVVRAEAEEAEEGKTEGSTPDVYLTLKITEMEASQSTSSADMASALYS
jgi:hypothetical protein